jgi:endo-1,4-beta-xylanase
MNHPETNFPAPLLVITLMLGTAVQLAGQTGEPVLKEVFRDHFYIGTALTRWEVSGRDSGSLVLVKKHFNSVSPGNVMKWSLIHPRPGEYNFSPADEFVEFGVQNGMNIVSHVLIWHNQTPRWIYQDERGEAVSRDTLLARMREHIFTVMGRYSGRIDCWDVVNEALNDDGTMHRSRWTEIIGEDYVQKAFEFAREADPGAILIYNDYNLYKPEKREGVIRLVKDLREKGIKVDAIGMQGHYDLYNPALEDFETSIMAFSGLGCDVMITELDVSALPLPWGFSGADIASNFALRDSLNPYPGGLPDSMQVVLANRYADLFMVMVRHSDKISRVTFWGTYDGVSWKNNFPVRGRTDYPLLFDRSYQPKPAFDAVIRVARGG